MSPDLVFLDLTRISFPLGWPLEGNITDKEGHKLVSSFLQNEVKPSLAESTDKYKDDIELSYISVKLFEDDVMQQAMYDLLLAVGSLAFIFCFIWFITQSIWITGWAVMSIITSFWITNLIYRIVLDYVYIGYFHLIAIFIILGIGADDIFVFYNSWKETSRHEYNSVAHQLSDAYRRSAGTMFFTSATTMSAFLSGGLSPILPLGSFGIFTGILVAVNYISVIVFFPTVIYTHHIMFNKYPKSAYNFSETNELYCEDDSIEQPHEYVETKSVTKVTSKHLESINQKTIPSSDYLASGQYVEQSSVKENYNKNSVNRGEIQNEEFVNDSKKSIVTRFLIGPYFEIITHRYCRFFILFIFLAVTGMLAWSATSIEVDSEEVGAIFFIFVV